jgi:hypothetical protein
VLDGVGEVYLAAVDARLRHRAVEELAGRTDEGLALQVLLVAGLLADEGNGGADRAFAEDGAGAALDHRIRCGDELVQFVERGGSVLGHRGLHVDRRPNARRARWSRPWARLRQRSIRMRSGSGPVASAMTS